MIFPRNRYTYRLLFGAFLIIFVGRRVLVALFSTIRADKPSHLLVTCLCGTILFMAMALFTFLFLAFLPISRLHNFKSAVKHFCLLIVLYVIGRYRWWLMDKASENPRKYQEARLLALLKDNADTEYGRLKGFKNIKNRESFKRNVPFSDYETYRHFIERMVEKGEQNLLTKADVVRFNVSSGTTGKSKLLPCPAYATYGMKYFIPISFRWNTLKSSSFLAPVKSLALTMVPKWRYTDNGQPIGPGSATLKHDRSSLVVLGRTLPVEAEIYLCEPAQCYVQWLFALFDIELGRIDALFAGGIVSAFDVLEKKWQNLAADIRTGRVSQLYDIPESLADQIAASNILVADPERADIIEKECSKGFKGIVQRLWPLVTSVSCAITGQHAIHRQRLQWYCGENVRLISLSIMASEGLIGMNMDEPSEVNGQDDQFYTLAVDTTFMEFIVEEDISKPDPDAIFMDELEEGQRYEIVLSSAIGLYRYRLGDIIEVVRLRHGKTPVVKFCARVGTLLDLRGEKTSEDVVFASLVRTCLRWKGCNALVNFTTTDSITWAKMFPPPSGGKATAKLRLFYVVFVEADGVNRELTQNEVVAFDEELRRLSDRFRAHRLQACISMPMVFTVAKGTFDRLKEMSLERNRTISTQYKTPRYIKNDEYLNLLASALYPNQEAAIRHSWL